jgi:hypothetical protein
VKEADPAFSGRNKSLRGERKQMRRMIFLAIGLFLFSIPSFAQEVIYPKAEVFGGFSISSIGVSSIDPTTGLPTSLRNSFFGWQSSANFNITHHLGIVADFGGQYKTIPSVTALGVTTPSIPMNNYQFLFGPRMVFRGPRITPFVHMLFGAGRSGIGSISITDPITGLTVTTPAVSSTGLELGMGGGIDINLSERFALRVPQFDWTPMRVSSIDPTTLLPTTAWSKSQIRIGIGLVLKAGGK